MTHMDNQSRNGHGGEAISLCMKRNHDECADRHTENFCLHEDLLSKTKEILLAQLKTNQLIERTRLAEREKYQLQSELHTASNEAKELAIKIQEANANAMSYKLMLQSMNTSRRNQDEHLLNLDEISHPQYSELSAGLDNTKQKVSSLKIDMASALEVKANAEKETETLSAKARLYAIYIEELMKEIEEAKIEQVLVDLARLNSEGELRGIEAQREAEATQFSKTMETKKTKITDLGKIVGSAKDLQKKLITTASEVNALQGGIEFIRAMNKSFQITKSAKGAKEEEKEQGIRTSLQSTKAELEAASKELQCLKQEEFQLMDEMDIARRELTQIADEKEQYSRTRKMTDSSLESLNAKLHKVMSKVESASMSEKSAQAIVSTLSTALQQLKNDIDAAKREAELTIEETKAVRKETEKIKLQTATTEERLEAEIQGLKTVKASEATSLQNLKSITESTMTDRDMLSLFSSTITISKYEYFYLIKEGKAAQLVADKKVAAAQAWLKALEAEVKERALKTEIARRGTWEIVPYEEKKPSRPNKALASKKAIKNELNACKQVEEDVQHSNWKLAIAMPSRSITLNGLSGAPGRVKIRRSSSSEGRWPSIRSPPLPLAARRRNVMINFVKFLQGQRSKSQV